MFKNLFQNPASRSTDSVQLEKRVEMLEELVRAMSAQHVALMSAHTQVVASQANDSHSTVLFKAIDLLTVIDQKISAHRSADFLGQVSALYPKSRTVVFRGRSYFGDNIKYAFLAFHQWASSRGIVCTFLPFDASQCALIKAAGLPCLPGDLADYTPQDIQTLLAAKIVVMDEQFVPPNWRSATPHALLRGAKTVQLWHGIPLKKIGLETIADTKIDDPATGELFAACGPFDVLVAPGSKLRAEWARKFAFRNFAVTGYPRNDVFFRKATPQDKINVDTTALAAVQDAQASGKAVILYAPTFRHDPNWIDASGLAAMAAFCQAQGYVLYVNLHPGEQAAVAEFRKRYPDVAFVAPHTDIYPILKHVSVMITDYSSLAFDFLLLDRPVIFYRPDHSDYLARSRDLIADHESYLCGPVVETVVALTDALAQVVATVDKPAADPYRATRLSLRDRLYDHLDGDASQRLCETIMELLDK